MTQTTVDLTDAALQRVLEDLYVATDTAAVDYNQLMRDIEQAPRQLPPEKHIGLLYDIFCALQRGGMDVQEHAPCALGELD